MVKNNSILYGILAGFGLLIFYLLVLSVFQNFQFAILNLRNLWYLTIPLVLGFGTQIGLYASIKHTALTTGTVVGTGSSSAGSMVLCCSHFLLNIIPLTGFSGFALFAMKYQPWFLSFGILSNFVGIGFMLNHKRKMKLESIPPKSFAKQKLKGGKC